MFSRDPLVIPTSLWAVRFNMAAVEGSLEEEALKRRERLKAMRKKSGLTDEQVSEMHEIFFRCFPLFSSSFGFIIILRRLC